MSSPPPPLNCPWPAVTRPCGACGREATPWDAGYVAVGMREGWRWSWRCRKCRAPEIVRVQRKPNGHAWRDYSDPA